jgi:hypothetical protein
MFGGFVVMNEECKERVERVVKAIGSALTVHVEPRWYYL